MKAEGEVGVGWFTHSLVVKKNGHVYPKIEDFWEIGLRWGFIPSILTLPEKWIKASLSSSVSLALGVTLDS